MSFHEIRFPTQISRGATGGPERRTDVVVLGSGFEERNARWADARRSYNAGYGIKSLDDLHAVITFFEERRGRLYGFRWKDHADFKSCPPEQAVSATDQTLGVGDGARDTFALRKCYGGLHAPYWRPVTKPVSASVRIAVDGALQSHGIAFDLDATNGTVTFRSGYIPGSGAVVTAGYEFDVPVRFDTDRLEVNLSGFRHGAIPSIPVIEIRV
jgi:uncharacterized protein (TIGR02217 family)